MSQLPDHECGQLEQILQRITCGKAGDGGEEGFMLGTPGHFGAIGVHVAAFARLDQDDDVERGQLREGRVGFGVVDREG